MLLRGIASAEARRNSARRVFKSRDRAQANGCDKDVVVVNVATDTLHDDGSSRGPARATIVHRAPEEGPPLAPVVFLIPLVSSRGMRDAKISGRRTSSAGPGDASCAYVHTARAIIARLASHYRLADTCVTRRGATPIASRV